MHTETIEGRETNGRGAGVSGADNTTVTSALSGLSRDFDNLMADVEHLVDSATSLSGEELARAKANLHARVATARQSVKSMGARLAERSRDTVRSVGDYAHDRPWRLVGVVAGLSLLVGYILARRAPTP